MNPARRCCHFLPFYCVPAGLRLEEGVSLKGASLAKDEQLDLHSSSSSERGDSTQSRAQAPPHQTHAGILKRNDLEIKGNFNAGPLPWQSAQRGVERWRRRRKRRRRTRRGRRRRRK